MSFFDSLTQSGELVVKLRDSVSKPDEHEVAPIAKKRSTPERPYMERIQSVSSDALVLTQFLDVPARSPSDWSLRSCKFAKCSDEDLAHGGRQAQKLLVGLADGLNTEGHGVLSKAAADSS